ncbi:unnamed protein product [Camellia sinensis]
MRSHLNLGISKPQKVSDDTEKAVADTSENSNFLKVSEDDSRTIAASPLEYDVKLEDAESFFGQFAKLDTYLNTDAGTMSPFEHGQVFVLDDGGQI